MMDLYEVLEQKAMKIGAKRYPYPPNAGDGVSATIEALKEMIVGEPMPAEHPILMSFEDDSLADGEEVMVLVVRVRE